MKQHGSRLAIFLISTLFRVSTYQVYAANPDDSGD